MNISDYISSLQKGRFDTALSGLYGEAETARKRYEKALNRFREIFPGREDIRVFSAPGRSEIGGNHTDHQNGCALGAAVDLDVIAVAAFHREGVVRIHSENHRPFEIELSDLTVHEDEKGTSKGIVRGIAAKFSEICALNGGFDLYSVSNVISGSGLSSSAAFETLIGTVFNLGYNRGETSAVEIAKIGQYAENVYFGKGSGLLDQLVCSSGGFVFIDFAEPENPAVKKIDFDFASAGYNLCVTDTKGSHSDLTDDYTAVPTEMKSVAAYFGKSVLREVDAEDFYAAVPDLHGKVSDRAILRAIHFFGENQRAKAEASALESGDIEGFFRLYRQSADSSANLLQNHYAPKKPAEQGIPLALAVSRLVLGENAAVRVHGGGFAGTVQAFVPIEKTEEYQQKMNALFGGGSCYVLRVRPVGGVEIK